MEDQFSIKIMRLGLFICRGGGYICPIFQSLYLCFLCKHNFSKKSMDSPMFENKATIFQTLKNYLSPLFTRINDYYM